MLLRNQPSQSSSTTAAASPPPPSSQNRTRRVLLKITHCKRFSCWDKTWFKPYFCIKCRVEIEMRRENLIVEKSWKFGNLENIFVLWCLKRITKFCYRSAKSSFFAEIGQPQALELERKNLYRILLRNSKVFGSWKFFER